MTHPKVKYCPFCGAINLKIVGYVPRCMECRSVFHVQFSRKVRKSPCNNKPKG